jgi:hypothetical protein
LYSRQQKTFTAEFSSHFGTETTSGNPSGKAEGGPSGETSDHDGLEGAASRAHSSESTLDVSKNCERDEGDDDGKD